MKVQAQLMTSSLQVQLIVYDEIHYLRDKERGVVWEESIIMAPKSARFVFLSATIPNAREFAEWIAKTHRSPCHVVYTDYRPTPLQHYLFPSGTQGLYMVVDDKGALIQPPFSACQMLSAATLVAIRAHSNQSPTKHRVCTICGHAQGRCRACCEVISVKLQLPPDTHSPLCFTNGPQYMPALF